MNHSSDNPGRGRGGGGRGGGGRGRGWWRGRGGYHPYQRGQHGGTNSRGGRGGGGDRGGGSQPLVVHGPLPVFEVKRTTQSTLYDVPSPFHGWKVFFPEEVFAESSAVVKKIRLFQDYIRRSNTFPSSASIEEKGFFSVDFKELIANSDVSRHLTDLADELKNSPEIVINCLSLAGHEKVVEELQKENGSYKSESDFCPSKIHCRIINYEPLTPLKLLKANYYGKFVSVRGTVVRVSSIKPLCVQMAYECTSCATIQIVRWPDGKCTAPTKCPGHDCRSRTFNPKRSHRSTHTVDCQTLRVQEIVNDDEQREAGRIPRTVDCEMTYDLVDRCVPGDMVTVSGVVKVMSSSEDGHSRQRDQCVFLLYISANSLTNAKGDNKMTVANSAERMSGVAMDFTMKELYAIQEIHSQPNLFRLLVASICPAIYGHELVKAGLVLGLFGGSHRYVNDKNRIPVRGDPHILIVGDPGLGKSQMLQSIAGIAPRSVYVCANTTTTSGLTVTLCRDGGGGDHALEAGALVLADQGCCCIDEFDKMGNQHQALLEAMEQQTISIAKAGIVCSLPARTSIIAAANPVGGHYNKAKTVAENLRMGSALLSRFDLVFILLDKPDEDMDSMLSEHVISLHAGKNRSVSSTPSSRHLTFSQQSTVHEDALKLSWEADKPLSERLKVSRNEVIEVLDFLPAQLLRKYIAYAKKYVHPKIGKEAADVLQNFYLDLRRKHHTQDSTPITTRQLESLIRLTEARTRLELREEATEEDAKQVVEIMKYSMVDTYSDDFGRLDFKRSQHGSGSSTRSQARRFIAVLQRLSETTGNSIFDWQELKQVVKDANIQVRDFETFIASLNDQGYLLKKGSKIYQLLTMA